MRWRDLLLRSKLLIGFAVVLTGTAIVSGSAILTVEAIATEAERVAAKPAELAAARELLSAEAAPAIAEIEALLSELDEAIRAQAVGAADISAMADAAGGKLLMVTGATLLVALLLALTIASAIARPASATVRFAQQLSAGDFTQMLPVERRDELGRLAESLNGVVAKLGRLFRDVDNGVTTLNAASSELTTVAEEMRPDLRDARLWAPVDPALTELTLEQRLELEMAGMLEAWRDSVVAAEAAERALTDWTFTDDDGGRWGVSPGEIHLGDFSLPLPFGFGVNPGRREEAAYRAWEWEELQRGQITGEVRDSWKARAEAIRARRDRARAESRPDSAGGG